ncbi:MAG: hypothetical protein KDE51_12615 [Anaerolineales bacterium]|nr:hypothetical protein [Anaerolineales bacterium]
MEGIVFSPLEIIEGSFIRYELPPEGISFLGYVVRRMHKTKLLTPVQDLTAQQRYPQALAQIAHYAAASSTSFGQLYYEPVRDQVGTSVMERDPETNAVVMATYENSTPESRFSFVAKIPTGDIFSGCETKATSKISLRGWTTPTQQTITYTTADESYCATLSGNIQHEIIPRLVGSWIIRAHGELAIEDNQGLSGKIIFRRDATATITLYTAAQEVTLTRDITLS